MLFEARVKGKQVEISFQDTNVAASSQRMHKWPRHVVVKKLLNAAKAHGPEFVFTAATLGALLDIFPVPASQKIAELRRWNIIQGQRTEYRFVDWIQNHLRDEGFVEKVGQIFEDHKKAKWFYSELPDELARLKSEVEGARLTTKIGGARLAERALLSVRTN